MKAAAGARGVGGGGAWWGDETGGAGRARALTARRGAFWCRVSVLAGRQAGAQLPRWLWLVDAVRFGFIPSGLRVGEIFLGCFFFIVCFIKLKKAFLVRGLEIF